MGVERGLAVFRFSTSPRRSGFFEINRRRVMEIHTRGVRSLIVNVGWNLILSICVFVPVGLEDPVTCRVIRWIRAIAEMAMGTRKWREKNRFRVG